MVAGRRQEALEALACLHVMAVLELRLVAASPLVAVLLPGARVAHDLARLLELLAVRAACPALRVPHLLLAGCLGKVVVAVVVVVLALEVLAVLEVAALAVVEVVLHAVHTPLALVVWAVMAGHWYWSIDNAAICRC